MRDVGSIWGKVMGGVAGFMMGGPVGAMFGAFAGHAVDRLKDKGVLDKLLPPPDPQVSFTVGVVSLAAKMARVDGAVSRDEVAAFRRIFHIPAHEERSVARLFDVAKREAAGFEPHARQLAETFADSPGILEELLEALFVIALADGPLAPAELDYLRSVATIFGLGEADFRRVLGRHQTSPRADPYQILGVAREAADEEVKAAYRRLIRETHPDTLIAQGLPAELIDLATQRMAAVNGAWERIKKERGLS